MTGWIMLHRKLRESPIYTDSQAVHLWVHLLMKANHKEKQIVINSKLITIERGQTLTGRKALSSETGIHESKIQRLLKSFQELHMIEQQTNSKNRLISIVNYDSHQVSEQQKNSKRTTDEQQMNTNNNVNNEKNVKNDNKYIPFDDFWNVYPKKTDKKKALAKWEKLKVDQSLFNKIKIHLSFAYVTTDKKYIPNPLTYLNGEKWNDEIINQPSVKNGASSNDNARQYEELFGQPQNDSIPIYKDERSLLEQMDGEDKRR